MLRLVLRSGAVVCVEYWAVNDLLSNLLGFGVAGQTFVVEDAISTNQCGVTFLLQLNGGCASSVFSVVIGYVKRLVYGSFGFLRSADGVAPNLLAVFALLVGSGLLLRCALYRLAATTTFTRWLQSGGWVGRQLRRRGCLGDLIKGYLVSLNNFCCLGVKRSQCAIDSRLVGYALLGKGVYDVFTEGLQRVVQRVK